MSKGIKTFIKVIYYIFTFLLGVLLAVLLQNWFAYDISMNIIVNSLKSANYSDAMIIVGGYLDKDYVYVERFDENSGIVLFSAATLTYSNSNDSKDDGTKLHKAYAGFIFGVADKYDTIGNNDNKSKVLITNNNDEKVDYSFLDYDSDGDKVIDSSSTLTRKNFIYLDFDEELIGSIKKIEFIDKNGNTSITIDKTLKYDEQFFVDVNDFLVEYNKDFESSALQALNDEFLAKDSSYAISSTKGAGEISVRRAIIIIISYFIVVYIFADIALGKR